MLAIAPARVDVQRAEVGAVEPLSAIVSQLRAGGVAAVSGNGILGDATTADATFGRQLVDEAVAELVALVRAWTRR
jgi:creatinine amidohydrolase